MSAEAARKRDAIVHRMSIHNKMPIGRVRVKAGALLNQRPVALGQVAGKHRADFVRSSGQRLALRRRRGGERAGAM